MSAWTAPGRRGASTLVRGVRLVEVGSPAPTRDPVDIRIAGGTVRELAPVLRPRPGDVVLDAAGRWAGPGLWDQHVHMSLWARTRVLLDVSAADGPAAAARIVAGHISRLPAQAPGAVVSGYGFRSATWARQPSVADLDTVSSDRPVILTSGDGHCGWVNSAALRLLGLPPRTDVLLENEWFGLQPAVARLSASEASDAALRAAVASAAAKGVVGIVDFEFAAGLLDWPERVAGGIDQLRVRPATYPDRLDVVVDGHLRSGDPIGDAAGLVTMGPLKIISDGSLNTRTAHCCEAYADAAGLEHPRGTQNFAPPELVQLLTRARDAHLETALHAIGDAAVAIALDAFAATGAPGGIEHVQLARSEDLARMARLGVRASVQPAHLLDDREVTQQCWPDRADRCFALRSMLDAGVLLAMGSDAPVAPLDPWLAMAAAVHRGAEGQEPWNPAESITAAEALSASTDGRTTLAVGSRGDVVLLADDPLRDVGGSAATAAHLRETRVEATIVDGHPTHLALG